jgi:hypothetical protein
VHRVDNVDEADAAASCSRRSSDSMLRGRTHVAAASTLADLRGGADPRDPASPRVGPAGTAASTPMPRRWRRPMRISATRSTTPSGWTGG